MPKHEKTQKNIVNRFTPSANKELPRAPARKTKTARGEAHHGRTGQPLEPEAAPKKQTRARGNVAGLEIPTVVNCPSAMPVSRALQI